MGAGIARARRPKSGLCRLRQEPNGEQLVGNRRIDGESVTKAMQNVPDGGGPADGPDRRLFGSVIATTWVLGLIFDRQLLDLPRANRPHHPPARRTSFNARRIADTEAIQAKLDAVVRNTRRRRNGRTQDRRAAAGADRDRSQKLVDRSNRRARSVSKGAVRPLSNRPQGAKTDWSCCWVRNGAWHDRRCAFSAVVFDVGATRGQACRSRVPGYLRVQSLGLVSPCRSIAAGRFSATARTVVMVRAQAGAAGIPRRLITFRVRQGSGPLIGNDVVGRRSAPMANSQGERTMSGSHMNHGK